MFGAGTGSDHQRSRHPGLLQDIRAHKPRLCGTSASFSTPSIARSAWSENGSSICRAVYAPRHLDQALHPCLKPRSELQYAQMAILVWQLKVEVSAATGLRPRAFSALHSAKRSSPFTQISHPDLIAQPRHTLKPEKPPLRSLDAPGCGPASSCRSASAQGCCHDTAFGRESCCMLGSLKISLVFSRGARILMPQRQ